MYDVIGDIHGYADELRSLLNTMGYEAQDGTWAHPERKALFLGDFIDRGPKNQEVVTIARSMVESGNGLAIMGNHEFNAVAWATPHPYKPGEYLREHSDKNRNQHQGFLEQVGEGSEAHNEVIQWFKTLPLFLDLPEFRAIHACWHHAQLSVIAPNLDEEHRIKEDAWVELTTYGSQKFEAAEMLLKGLEIPLPSGYKFRDEYNNPRRKVRARWWDLDRAAYRDVAMVPEHAYKDMPDQNIPTGSVPGYDGKKPVFVGHYWFKGTPEPLTDQIACLDYSVVDSKGGKLCAYRWDGKPTLSSDNFIWVKQE